MCSFANSAPGNGQLLDRGTLDIEVTKQLVTDLAPVHPCISLTGGEPFLWKPLFEVFEHARRLNVMCTVTTNGTLIKRRFDDLMATPPDVMAVSILGPREVHDEIVGSAGRYDDVVEGIRMVNEAKGNDPWARPLIVLNTTMVMENADSFSSVVELAQELDTTLSHFQHLWFTTDEMVGGQTAEVEGQALSESIRIDESQVDPDLLWNEMRRAMARSNGLYVRFFPDLSRGGVRKYYNEPLRLVGPRRAVCAWLFAHVLPNGAVSPCLGFEAGNLYTQRFAEIWNSPKMVSFRRHLVKVGALPICNRCCAYFRRD
jgi:MoaA/NifB/PqqE/SkfB family radical SAM enzyme